MKKLLLSATLLLGLASPAWAETYDPLHFTCSNCGGDNGVFTPSNGTPTGITVDETGTLNSLVGDFILKVLVPNNTLGALANTVGVNGTVGVNPLLSAANLFVSPTLGAQWTSGSLETFLGFPTGQGAPPNPIDAFLTSTQGVDPGATGFFVLTLDLGNLTVPEQNKGISPFALNLLNSTAGLWVLGDLISSSSAVCGNAPTPCDITTAQSAALFATTVSEVPLPGAVWLFGTGLAGLIVLGRKRRANKLNGTA